MQQSTLIDRLVPDLNETTSFPSVLEFQTQTRCNASCTCCPYDALKSATHHGRMADELLHKILDECVKHRSKIAQIVPYHNNEPFLDRRFIDVLRHIKRHVLVPTEVSTNASSLTKTVCEQICSESLIDTLRISFFGGTKENYEQRMGLSWERAVRNVNLLLEAASGSGMKIELVIVATHSVSEQEVFHMREEWEPKGARVMVFGYMDRAGSVSVLNRLPHHAHSRKLAGCDLNRPFERICITATGDCIICSQDWTRKEVLGNVTHSTIEAVWNGKLYATMRAKMTGAAEASSDFICRSCKLAIFQ